MRYRVYCPDIQEEREIDDDGWGPGHAASEVVQRWQHEEWFLEEDQPLVVEVSDAATGKPCGAFKIKYHMEPVWECDEVTP